MSTRDESRATGAGQGTLCQRPPCQGLPICPQLEQFGLESPSTSLALDPPGFTEGPGFLGGEGPVSGSQDLHTLNHQNLTHCSRHGSGPNIILSGKAALATLRGLEGRSAASTDTVEGSVALTSVLYPQETLPQVSPRRSQQP